MKCPHCIIGIHSAFGFVGLAQDRDPAGNSYWQGATMVCPAYGNSIIQLLRSEPGATQPDCHRLAAPLARCPTKSMRE
jgi:hypothetical protein